MKISNCRVVFAVFALLLCARSTPAAPETKPEMVIQLGHSSEVKAVAYSPDGKWLASAGADFQVRIWNVQTHELHRLLSGVADEVCDVEWSPNASSLIGAIGDGTLAIWNLENASPQIIKAHSGAACAVAFSPDGKQFASSGADGRVRLWNSDGHLLREVLFPEKSGVSSLAFSSDGSTLASGSGERYVQSDDSDTDGRSSGAIGLWDLKTAQIKIILRGHKNDITALAFSPDRSTLLSASADGTARLWNLKTNQTRAVLKGHVLGVTDAAWSRDGKTVVTGSNDATLKLWNAATGKGLRTLTAHEGQNYSVAISPDGNSIASGSDDKCVRLWNLATGKVSYKWPGEMNWIESLAVSPRGDFVAAGYWGWIETEWDEALQERNYDLQEPSATRLWDLDSGELQRVLPPFEDEGTSTNLFFSINGSILLNDSMTQWNVASGQAHKIKQLAAIASEDSIALSPDGTRVASLHVISSVGSTSELAVSDFKSGHKLWSEKFDNEPFDRFPLAFSPDGKFLAAVIERVTRREKHPGGTWIYTLKEVQVREVNTGQLLHQLALPDWRTLALAWSPDGSILAAGSRDGSVRIWKARTFQFQKMIQVTRREINELTFSPDGNTLAAATDDGKIHLLDARTGKTTGELKGHAMWVTAIQFSPDGKRLVSGGSDNTIKIWDLPKRKLLLTLQALPEEKRDQISDQWIAFTPDGFYTGSKDCEKFIRWRVGEKLIEGAEYSAQFRRPDLVSKALSP